MNIMNIVNIIPNLRKAAEFGIGIAIISALVLAGCGGGSTSSPAGTSTNDLTVTPMKGKFSNGTTVKVKRAQDSVVVASGTLDSTGSVTIKVPATETGPFLIEAGIAGDSYFDESTGASAVVPAGTIALRALIPDATSASAVGVTALTEMAVGEIEGASGIAAATSNIVLAANTSIGNQFGVTDPLAPPTVIGQGTQVAGSSTADNYALVLAGLAKMAASGVPALKALQDMRDDMKDGTFDGTVNGVAINTLRTTTPATGQTFQQMMSLAITSQVAAATSTYASAGATAPTITLTVSDLAGLLQAAIKVGADARTAAAGSPLSSVKLNAQIAGTMRDQMAVIASAVQGGSSVAEAQTVASVNAAAAGAILANATTAGKNFLTALASGWYRYNGRVTTTGDAIIEKTVGTGSGSSLTLAHTKYSVNRATGLWETNTQASNSWTLTSTSAGGWVRDGSDQVNLVTNADSSITYTVTPSGISITFFPRKVTLDGMPLGACGMYISLSFVSCTATDVYPTGSLAYFLANPVLNQDSYSVSGSVGGTDGNGVTLTALPALGTDFCAGGVLFSAIAGAVAGANNYSIIYSACNAAAITAAKARLAAAGTSVLLESKATGNSAASTVLLVTRIGTTLPANAWMKNQFLAYVNGGIYRGSFTPKGSISADPDGNLNKIAMDANVIKVGASALP